MIRHYKHFWVLALIYNCLLHQLSLGSPVFVRHFLSEGIGRNIRHLPCVSRRTGETGVCMFAFTCAKANGTHLGTCIDRFYFGSCCKIEEEADHIFPQDNAIDVDNPLPASKPFVTSSTASESNDVPGNVDRLKTTVTTTANPTRPTEAPKTTQTTQTSQKAQMSTQATRRPSTSIQSTTESIRLSTFQTVQNTSEHDRYSSPGQTTLAITKPTSTTPSSTPAFGQRITSIKPSSSSTSNSTKTPISTTTNAFKTQSVEKTRPRPSPNSTLSWSFTSPTSIIRRNVTSSPSSTSMANVTRVTSVTTTPASVPALAPTTIPMTVPTTILATRFPPRNATTTTTTSKLAETSTRPSSVATESKPSSTRKPTTTKKPIKFTTKRRNPPTKRPYLTTTQHSPTIVTTVGANSTVSTTRRPSSPTASNSKKPISTVTNRPTSTVTNPTTSKPATSFKQPTGTTLTRPVTTDSTPSRKPVTSTPISTASATITPSARPPTTASTKPASTNPASTRPISSIASPSQTEKPVKVSVPSLATSGTWGVPSTIPSTTESTRKPSTTLSTSTAGSTRKPSPKPPTSTATAIQKNATNHNTVLNELDAEFANETENATTAATTITHGIVTWTSFSDDTEHFTQSPESSTVATESTETLEWTPITTPDGWIIIQSPTSSEKPEEKRPVQQNSGTTSSSQTASPPPPVTAKPSTESTTRQTTMTSATTTTTTTTTTIHKSTTQPTTYVDALSTLATVSLSPEFSITELPPLPLNMTNYKDVCGRRLFPESRIVGGDGSTFGKWPWQISLRQWRTSTYLHKCGAALLNENWAITAAHCVQNVLPSDLLLRIGEHDLGNEEEPYGFQERRVQIVASHPNFDPRTFEFDLALMRFYEPVLPFQPNVLPICVPDNDEDYVGQTAFVTGWGRLYEDGPLPSVLQEVAVPVINNSVCEGMYRNAGYIEHIPHIFICAGWRKGGFDSCEGDSGGPLVIQRKRDKRWVLAGVISWGIGCAEPNQPGVYTRISEFREWINQILQF